MGSGSGVALKFLQWFIRGIQFGCAALILAIYSYFLATLHNHHLSIATSLRAVEGISGFAVLYTIAALLLLCCLAGRTLSSFIAIIFDVAFLAAFIYVAVANGDGAGSCTGNLDTPFGRGKDKDTVKGSKGFTALPSYHTACRLQTACLAVAIIAIFFFVFSILMEVALGRHHQKEKRFGADPSNNYTSGDPTAGNSTVGTTKGGFLGRLFSRRKRTFGPDENALPEFTTPDQLETGRPSHGTDRTAVAPEADNSPYNKYETTGYSYQEPYSSAYGHRQDGYGHIHYPEAEETGTQQLPQGYHYDDGVYNRT